MTDRPDDVRRRRADRPFGETDAEASPSGAADGLEIAAPSTARASRGSSPSHPSGWVRWFAIAYLLVQIGLPLFQLARPRPARFGWQMYSAVRPVDIFFVDRAGERRAIDGALLDLVRADLDALDAIAPELCANPAVVRVVEVERSTGAERSWSCR
ncbi:MAG TPA: hypothetical protein VMT85_21050 [Thermoanaerobaculia bacterium]|nr:hypothetical protein [Thermoanaerobaculia bacterium]